jgi:hypothetical protein
MDKKKIDYENERKYLLSPASTLSTMTTINILNKIWDIAIYVIFVKLWMKEDPFAPIRGNCDSLHTRHSSTNRSSKHPSFCLYGFTLHQYSIKTYLY